ncbi:MAG: hypothetical protein AAFQ79_07925 [Pseudomonadota bacterium]
MHKLLTLSAGAALMGTTTLAQTSFPPAIQGQIDRLVANGFTVTEVYRDGRYAEIDATGPDGLLYELELNDNRWEMSLRDDDDEDEDEDEDEGFDDEEWDDEDESYDDEDEDEGEDDEDEDEAEDEDEDEGDDEDEDEGDDE